MVELRRFADRELPGPSGFLTGLSRSIVERVPEGWADHLLRGGNAVLLLDGVDEFPAQRLSELLEWIGELAHDYPRIRIFVTSRPAATPPARSPSTSSLRELVLLNNSAVPDLSALLGMPSLTKLHINGLARHLGPDADRYVGRLQAAGIQVQADGYEDEWLFEETNEDGWADPEDLAAIGGYEDFAPIQRRAPRMRVTRR